MTSLNSEGVDIIVLNILYEIRFIYYLSCSYLSSRKSFDNNIVSVVSYHNHGYNCTHTKHAPKGCIQFTCQADLKKYILYFTYYATTVILFPCVNGRIIIILKSKLFKFYIKYPATTLTIFTSHDQLLYRPCGCIVCWVIIGSILFGRVIEAGSFFVIKYGKYYNPSKMYLNIVI